MAGMRIVGYGFDHGDKVVTNEDMKKYVETDDQWIQDKTGIKSRYFAEKKSNLDMATEAAKKALSMADEGEPDAVIVATFTPDSAAPSTAARVCERLGLSGKILNFDLNGACAGFVYGLVVANALLKTGYKKILLIGSEKIHPLMDMTDRTTCILFGDAAGAVLLENDENGCFANIDGLVPSYDILHCDRYEPKIEMQGQEVYRFAVSSIPESAMELLEKANMSTENIDMFFFHQANLRIIESAAKKMKLPKEKYYINVEKYGNTSAASVVVALSEALEKGEVKSGDKIVALGFGAGLTYGGVLMSI